jgi:hypothetical protein
MSRPLKAAAPGGPDMQSMHERLDELDALQKCPEVLNAGLPCQVNSVQLGPLLNRIRNACEHLVGACARGDDLPVYMDQLSTALGPLDDLLAALRGTAHSGALIRIRVTESECVPFQPIAFQGDL